jgi:hypothetical protein
LVNLFLCLKVPPNRRFRYFGDVICLGQANIREHTFKIKSAEARRFGAADGVIAGKNSSHETLEEMVELQKSLIIELTEVERERVLKLN